MAAVGEGGWIGPPVACECGEAEDARAARTVAACGCCAVRFDDPGQRDCDCCDDRAAWTAWTEWTAPSEPDTVVPTPRAGVRRRNGNAYSTVFTVRIGHREWREVCRRSEQLGMGPSVWVRALVRTELGHTYDW